MRFDLFEVPVTDQPAVIRGSLFPSVYFLPPQHAYLWQMLKLLMLGNKKQEQKSAVMAIPHGEPT